MNKQAKKEVDMRTILFSGILLVAFFMNSYCIQSLESDKSLAPYFFVQSDDPSLDQLPLKLTEAMVHISGVIADVHITQIYKNEGERPIEAIYIFPASTRAAVYFMQMKIGERTITAKIAEKEAARQEYEQARQEGKSASLLEQQRPNVFQMNVANIIPGDEIHVELHYTELLVPQDAVYQFVYPTVVGPRYSNLTKEEANKNESWVANPYLEEGKTPTYDFNLNLNLSAGMPIQEIRCPSHKVEIDYDGTSDAHIKLAPGESNSGNRDFILEYRLAGEKIQSGLLLFQGNDDEENFFLAMIQPPQRIRTDIIPPREYIFIVDVSGSMNGFPISISKKLLKDLINGLKQTDVFNVLLFASGSSVLAESSLPATEANIQRAIRLIDHEHGSGGTEILPALKRALHLPHSEGFSRTVVIVTDGYVRVEKGAFDIIRNNLNQANVFAFGIGSSVNRYIIEGMARVGMGDSFVITDPSEAEKNADKFRAYISMPVLTRIQYNFKGFEAYDIEPPVLPDLFSQRPLILFGKWKGTANGQICFLGKTGDNKEYQSVLNVREYRHDHRNRALRYLWARHRIALLSDYSQLGQTSEEKEEITRLGLAYNLLTEFTSFVAIDSKIRNVDGKQVQVTQPLPLPHGVSNYAVGGRGIAASLMKRSYSSDMALQAVEKAPSPVVVKAEFVLGKLSVDKEGSIESIKRFIEGKLKELSQCLKRYSQSALFVQNKRTIEIEFKIDGDGKVKDIRVISGGLSDPKVSICLKKKIGSWEFQLPMQHEEITVRLPLSVRLSQKIK
jgi:Ca-activated chloride channel family protein